MKPTLHTPFPQLSGNGMQDKYAYCYYLLHYGDFYKRRQEISTISQQSEKCEYSLVTIFEAPFEYTRIQ